MFPKPKDDTYLKAKTVIFLCQISRQNWNAVYVNKTGHKFRAKKRNHVDAIKTFNIKVSILSQHVMDFDRRIK